MYAGFCSGGGCPLVPATKFKCREKSRKIRRKIKHVFESEHKTKKQYTGGGALDAGKLKKQFISVTRKFKNFGGSRGKASTFGKFFFLLIKISVGILLLNYIFL